jgi:hypothetical protein
MSQVASDIEDGPLPAWSRELVGLLDGEAIVDEIVEKGMREAFAAHEGDAELADTFRAGVRENLATLQSYLTGEITLADIAPARPLKLAALQARLEIPESAIQQSYRIGTRVMISAWTRDVGSHCQGHEVATHAALEVVERFTLAMMDFQTHVLRSVSAAHETELAALRASRVQMRRQLLRDVLRGDHVASSADLSAALAYDVNLNHLAIVLPLCSEARGRQVVDQARTAAQATSAITLPLRAGATALWLARARAWTERAVADVVATLAGAELVASVGVPQAGIEGLRESYQQAGQAEVVRTVLGADAPAILNFADVQLESLAISDLSAARRFVEHELGALMSDDQTAARLRETLLVWFETGSHVSTAAKLRLHEHSVRNRLRRAEEAIGHALTVRRTDLQVALRLYRVVHQPNGDVPPLEHAEP